ncbi:MAG: HAD-IA family hydrolase [Myxococcales bacterium]|nr:HAD-IA family hydrolase [Myxococcales bacterium]
MRPAVFLFDLDGTLLDTAGDLADAVNAARAGFDLPPLADAQVAANVGHGLGHLMRAALPAHLHDRVDEARARFMAHYDAHLLERARPCPGAEAVLAALPVARRGLVTNAPSVFLSRLLAGLGWAFGAVIDGDVAAWRKPAPGGLLAALSRLGARPDEALFIGDTDVDRAAAAAAGVPFATVAWGAIKDASVPRLDRLDGLLTWA